MKDCQTQQVDSMPVHCQPILEVRGATGEAGEQQLSRLLAELSQKGLRLALVCQHDQSNALLAERPGATILYRSILDPAAPEDTRLLHDLVGGHDLVLLLGDYQYGAAQLLFQPSNETKSAEPNSPVVYVSRPGDTPSRMNQAVQAWLTRICTATPLWACVLIGGRSSRMGSPKHLLAKRNATWLEETVALLRPLTHGIILSGSGDVPQSLSDLPRLADAPGVQGPLAGILAAMRWQPRFSWLLLACDMPVISSSALEWLLARRAPGSWGVVPRLEHDGFVEPLLAHYDFRAARYFEDLATSNCFKIGQVARRSKIETPVIPEALRDSWLNINTPAQLKAARELF
ncbi:MAG: NTP transferase domain-containing protein [Desulfobulbaceae bacterium]|uniref:NTP transferase domain-containing protein n=1 Tax=Candidatus Desulfatifera sulfidica TaxID=2841691 RepID=A0A8J6TAM8_9BACT|nr:NTP transferase domain-containing protein [Candidatus Desulfatifera sulfidica]